MSMEQQDFSAGPKARYNSGFKPKSWIRHYLHKIRIFLARCATFGGAIALASYATYEMTMIVSLTTVTALQWVMVVMFALTFSWIALAATSAVSGILFGAYGAASKAKSQLSTKTALLMPVYNEDPASSFSSLAAMADELANGGHADNFEIFIISDTNSPEAWVKETAAIAALRNTIKNIMPIWYRRRSNNEGKKAGNVEDFVKKWGGRYDFMLVLDADSVMSAEAIVTLVSGMENDPRCGILQTVPKLYGGETFFARMQQFASYAYGETVALGISSWQGDDGNYWGHNALIRIKAFAMSAGLPQLPGRKPFGGAVMSHDFVEAALIRRSGWTVKMLPFLSGSWEEGPPTLKDIAIRDRRWAQGNLQHLAVLPTKGLTWSNRAHMIIGVMSYLASPLWLALITVGLMTYFQSSNLSFDYFKEDFSLYPTWPIFDSERMVKLFILTIVVLLLPKIIGLVRRFLSACIHRPLSAISLPFSVVIETVFSVLYAPIFMLIHSKQIVEILLGRDSGWSSQQRKGHSAIWKDLFKRHFGHMFVGIALTAFLYFSSKPLLAWMSPTLIGLVFAIPLAALSGDRHSAKILKALGLLNIPEERNSINVIRKKASYSELLSDSIDSLTIKNVLIDPRLSMQHLSAVTGAAVHQRGNPNVSLLTTTMKIEDGRSVDEVLSWLDKDEQMTLLSNKNLCELMIKLHEKNANKKRRNLSIPQAVV